MSKELCSVCGSREAVYFRRASGEKLCARCLERSIIKNLRRGLSRVKDLLKPKSILLYIIPPFRVIEGITILYLLDAIEKSFGSVFYALAPNTLTNVKLSPRNVYGILYYKYHSEGPCVEAKEIIDSIIAIITTHIRRLEPKPKLAITPLTLNDFAEYVLSRTIKGELPEDLGLIRVNGTILINPLINTLREDILVLAYHKGIFRYVRDFCVNYCEDYKVITELIAELCKEHHEVVYRLPRTLELIRSYVRKGAQHPSFLRLP